MGLFKRVNVGSRERLAAGLVLLWGCIAVVGCDSGPPKPDASTQATVSGSVTNDGKPITADSSVVFFCTEKAATAAGKVDALGKFSLKEADPKIGIPVGRYQVMIRPPAEKQVAMGTSSDEYKKMMGSGGAAATPAVEKTSDIPAAFQSFDTTKVSLEIKAGPNTIDLDLAKLPQ